MPSRSDRKTMPCSASSRIVVITSAALRPKRSMPMTTMASPSRVPERDRTLLTLRFFENMSQSQIAERLGMSPNARVAARWAGDTVVLQWFFWSVSGRGGGLRKSSLADSERRRPALGWTHCAVSVARPSGRIVEGAAACRRRRKVQRPSVDAGSIAV
jgi:hypothetical protein